MKWMKGFGVKFYKIKQLLKHGSEGKFCID